MKETSPEPGAPLTIPVLREELQVGVRRVERGGVRIVKSVSVEQQQAEAELVRDAVDVRRVPIDRVVALSEAPAARQEGDTLIVPVLEEILVVEKRLRIKEEIHITRTAHTEHVSEPVSLRSEQLTVERFEADSDPEVTSTKGGNHHATHSGSRI
jgi:uncharacterized protein (TIGR02271 family)